jgi:hypothetical protein
MAVRIDEAAVRVDVEHETYGRVAACVAGF